MRFVFAIEGSLFILAIFAFLVALVARIRWRWLRLIFFLLAAVLSPVPLLFLARAGKWYTAKYPTVMTCGWGCVVAVILGATVLPMVGLWRRGAARTPVARSWRIGWLTMFPGATLAVVVLTVVLRDVYVRRWIAEVRKENDAFIASVSPPPIAPQDDAAPALRSIYLQMLRVERLHRKPEAGPSGLPSSETELPEWLSNVWQPNFEINRGDVTAFRDRHHECVVATIAASKLRGASLRPPGSTIIDESRGDGVDVLRALYRLVALEARQQAHDGKVEDFWETLSCLARLGEYAGAQRDEIWAQVGKALNYWRSIIVETALTEPALDAGEFSFPISVNPFTHRLTSADASCRDTAELLEIACATDLCELDDDPRLLSEADRQLFRRAWPMRSLYALYHRVFVLADGLATLPSELRRFQKMARQAPYEQPASEAEWLNNLCNPPKSETSHIAWLAPSAVYRTAIDADAERRLTATGIAVAGFQARNHRDPNSLDELVPDYLSKIPVDPWDGQPLRMRHADGGVILYSVGEDLVDDEGLGDLGEYISPDLPFHLGGAYPKHQLDMKRRREMMNRPRQ